jgi:2-polyprenyl-6-methoxyphenol hydroxylase-like FAD-dependent oxidoreductase
LLARQGHDVFLFDQMAGLKPVGAGVLLQPSGQMVLAAMGLLDAVVAHAEPIERLIGFNRRGGILDDLPYGEPYSECRAYGLHRADLFNVFEQALSTSGVHVQFSSPVEGTRLQDDTVVLLGPEARELGAFDFVLACDGLKSKLRVQSRIPTWDFHYRNGALWALGRCEKIRRKLHQNTVGARILCGLLPMGEGRCSLFWSMHEKNVVQWRNTPFGDWKKEVLAVCPESEELLAGLATHDDVRFTTYRHVVMSSWHQDRTLFLGDAAHAISPHTGQGINLALMDAWVFAQTLAETGAFTAACERYTRRRADQVRFYAFLTLTLAPFFQSNSAILGWGRDIALPILQRIPFIRRQMILSMSGLKAGFFSGPLKTLSL